MQIIDIGFRSNSSFNSPSFNKAVNRLNRGPSLFGISLMGHGPTYSLMSLSRFSHSVNSDLKRLVHHIVDHNNKCEFCASYFKGVNSGNALINELVVLSQHLKQARRCLRVLLENIHFASLDFFESIINYVPRLEFADFADTNFVAQLIFYGDHEMLKCFITSLRIDQFIKFITYEFVDPLQNKSFPKKIFFTKLIDYFKLEDLSSDQKEIVVARHDQDYSRFMVCDIDDKELGWLFINPNMFNQFYHYKMIESFKKDLRESYNRFVHSQTRNIDSESDLKASLMKFFSILQQYGRWRNYRHLDSLLFRLT